MKINKLLFIAIPTSFFMEVCSPLSKAEVVAESAIVEPSVYVIPHRYYSDFCISIQSFVSLNYRFPDSNEEFVEFVKSVWCDEYSAFCRYLTDTLSLFCSPFGNRSPFNLSIDSETKSLFSYIEEPHNDYFVFDNRQSVSVALDGSFSVGRYFDDVDSILSCFYNEFSIVPTGNLMLLSNGFSPVYKTVVVRVQENGIVDCLYNSSGVSRRTLFMDNLKMKIVSFMKNQRLSGITFGVVVPLSNYSDDIVPFLASFLKDDVNFKGYMSRLLSQVDYNFAYGFYCPNVESFVSDLEQRAYDPNYNLSGSDSQNVIAKIKNLFSVGLTVKNKSDSLCFYLGECFMFSCAKYSVSVSSADYMHIYYYDKSGRQIFLDKSVRNNDLSFWYVENISEDENCMTAVYRRGVGFWVDNARVLLSDEVNEVFRNFSSKHDVSSIKFPLPIRLCTASSSK